LPKGEGFAAFVLRDGPSCDRITKNFLGENTMKKAIRIVLILLFLGIFLFAAWNILEIGMEYRQGEEEYQQMEEFVVLPESVQGATLGNDDTDFRVNSTLLATVVFSPFSVIVLFSSYFDVKLIPTVPEI
jgi:hypothetical protein